MGKSRPAQENQKAKRAMVESNRNLEFVIGDL
jgi:hypothetical protein